MELQLLRINESRPTRARGLKQLFLQHFRQFFLSRPTRARGLKLFKVVPSVFDICRAPRGRVD